MDKYLSDRVFALLILLSTVGLVLLGKEDAAIGVGVGGCVMLTAKATWDYIIS